MDILFCSTVSRLDRRIVADTFYWHEMEQEIRERGMTWVFKGTVDEMKDSFMDHVDSMRRHEIYTNTLEGWDCNSLY